MSELEIQDVQEDQSSVTASSIIWNQFLNGPAPKPLEELTEEKELDTSSQIILDAPKKRGRPRKYLPQIEGKILHKLGDDDPNPRKLLPSTVHKIILDFKEYLSEGLVPKEAIEEISSLYDISYAQAYNLCANEM